MTAQDTTDQAVLDDDKVQRLLARARREVDDGLSPGVQLAVGLRGEVVLDETIGVPPESRFLVFSATKALVAAAMWRLLDRGEVVLSESAATYVPEFATNGKEVVTVEHLLTHTGGSRGRRSVREPGRPPPAGGRRSPGGG